MTTYNFCFICKTEYSKPVKQEVNSTVILPPLVFPVFFILSVVPSQGSTVYYAKVYRFEYFLPVWYLRPKCLKNETVCLSTRTLFCLASKKATWLEFLLRFCLLRECPGGFENARNEQNVEMMLKPAGHTKHFLGGVRIFSSDDIDTLSFL